MKELAQNTVPLGPGIGGSGLGPFANTTSEVTAVANIARVVSSVIGFITLAAGIWFLLNFILGGFEWIASGGDKHKLENAQHKLTNAFIGLIIVVASWAILALASTFFGVDLLLRNSSVITNLGF